MDSHRVSAGSVLRPHLRTQSSISRTTNDSVSVSAQLFSIATLALAVVVQTLITNWDFVGGARGAYVLRPKLAPLIGGAYIEYLFLVMLGLCVVALATARAIERSALGFGFVEVGTLTPRPQPYERDGHHH